MFKPLLMSVVAVTALAATAPAVAQSAHGDRLYRMTILRAAPGRLVDLLDDVKKRVAATPPDRGRPLLLRHSQGDQWDLFLLVPAGVGVAPVDRSVIASPALVAWQQDSIVRGPDVWSFPGFAEAALCHIEMFVSLAGKRDDLIHEREMENAYLKAVGRPVTAIFVREFGAEWDVFTIGPYRSWKHYAERDDITPAQALAAAKQAGFESDAQIGPYLRSLINTHHDNLVTVVK
jgi:hypothetical protein